MQEASIKVNKKKGNKSFNRHANQSNNAFFILITANVIWKITLQSIDTLLKNYQILKNRLNYFYKLISQLRIDYKSGIWGQV